MAAVDPALISGCQQFEAVVLRPLLDGLHLGRVSPLAASDEGDSGDRNSAGELLSSLFADALSLALARAGGVGLANELVRALSAMRP